MNKGKKALCLNPVRNKKAWKKINDYQLSRNVQAVFIGNNSTTREFLNKKRTKLLRTLR